MPRIAESKCVVLVAEGLPTGLAVNAASVVSLTLGRKVDGLIGPDVKDADSHVHAGVTLIPVPVLRTGADRIADIARQLADTPEVILVGFTSTAQGCKTYEEYIEKMSSTPSGDLAYVGLGIFGPRKIVNRVSGDLPLLR